MTIIVKIPKFYRISREMDTKWVGPFSNWKEAEQWVSETFVDYTQHVFTYVQVFKP